MSRVSDEKLLAWFANSYEVGEMIFNALEQANKAIQAAGHRVEAPGCAFSGCTCGAVESFRVERGEFWRQIIVLEEKLNLPRSKK